MVLQGDKNLKENEKQEVPGDCAITQTSVIAKLESL